MSTFIQTLIKRDRIDDPVCWSEPDVTGRPDFDADAFQKRIDRVTGKTRDGKSIVRLKWAWDEDCFSLFFTKWDAAGSPTKGEARAKYLYRRVELDSETTVDIAPPRWILEERIEPAQYLDAWEENRWQFDAQLQRSVVIRPSAPRDGYYTLLWRIEMHDPENKCCARALEAEQECFGVYREPAQFDLTRLARTKQQIELRGKQNPYEPLSSETFARIQAETEAAERERHEEKQIKSQEDRRFYTDVIKPRTEYSLPNEQTTESGLIIPGGSTLN